MLRPGRTRTVLQVTHCNRQLMFGECLQYRYRDTCRVGWPLYSFRMLRALPRDVIRSGTPVSDLLLQAGSKQLQRAGAAAGRRDMWRAEAPTP